MRKQLFSQAFALLAVIALSHYLASVLYIYWTVWWFDMVMHFLAGLCVAMGGISVWLYIFNKTYLSRYKNIFIGLFFVVVVGLLWEVFELNYDITFFSDGAEYWTDTISDLVLDISGGVAGVLYAYYLENKNKNKI